LNEQANHFKGFTLPDGTRHYPSTALLCDFAPTKGPKPYLLNNQDRVTLFHELGHSIHDLVSKTRFARCHGPPATPVDFGEAPSQLLENWCRLPEVLKPLSKHWSYLSSECLDAWKDEVQAVGEVLQQPPEQLPDEIIKKLVTTLNVNQSLFHLVELERSIFDMVIHQPQSYEALNRMDISLEWVRLGRELRALDYDGIEIKRDNRFMMVPQFVNNGDYNAGYYSYLFSQVFADDIFQSVFERDPMNAEVGLRYRRLVLEKGGSENGLKLVEDLLGRKPDASAFYKRLGLD
jgi:metallopeptidase MepB